jgi:hypothetical protein
MKTFFKLILILLIIAILYPFGWFAWRAGQPMDLPQFKGLTYYEYLHWRKSALHQMAVDYQAALPDKEMGGGLDMCYNGEIIGSLTLTSPMTGFYALAGAYPDLQKHIPPRDQKYVPQDVTFWTFLPAWWKSYEQVTWYLVDSRIHDPVPYCRLAGTPPDFAANP